MTRHRLLFIDDDLALGRLVQRQLQRLGYDVDVAPTGLDGLTALNAAAFDAVALDHFMPDHDGLDILNRIRLLPDPPPVVFVTATSESRIAVAALKAGAADYVVKDIGGEFVELLEAALRSAMAGVQLRRAKDAAEREVRAARDRFEALAAERQVLLREVNHRVGNSLQLVAAFLHMQASSSATPETRTALAEANRRVIAIAQVHRRLYASEDVTSVALGGYLAGLIEDIRMSTDAEGIGDLLSLETDDDVMIDADRAVTIGIIVTELVINAMKYAYPDTRGPIRVKLAAANRDGGSAYRLRVEDDGVGKTADPSKTSLGLGRTIIRAMASKLSSTVTYEPGQPGTRAQMIFMLPARPGV